MSWKFALQSYIRNPQDFGKEEVVFFDDEVAIIHDKFAKSVCHLLVIVRNKSLSSSHPTIALKYEVKDKLAKYIAKAQDYVYDYFTKRFKPLKLQPYFDSKESFHDKESFIENFIQVGVHSVPSMANLHIHVMTKDLNSDRLKNKKHYNSFTTDFFVSWDRLPLSQIADVKTTENRWLKDHDLICHYCGRNFDSKFSKLKQHLTEEFDNHFASV
ncbi:hypothetical protein HG536_0A08080 [Torulaspora globosa]|uniref:Uncharacterized protein n=1 Tax=Torulaspora globosa TaxID=48254 RepID=A0A7G3ZBV7_9SACH|nr:uncharacterized protein HG536_0A08080 [Torulaspora globosa]QLL30993.1 hypothetical protein HG536_0A08080 [Torulaspora globosa]